MPQTLLLPVPRGLVNFVADLLLIILLTFANFVRMLFTFVVVAICVLPYSAFMTIRYFYRRRRHPEQFGPNARVGHVRRKKKERLMTQAQVDEKFPLMSYKQARTMPPANSGIESPVAGTPQAQRDGETDNGEIKARHDDEQLSDVAPPASVSSGYDAQMVEVDRQEDRGQATDVQADRHALEPIEEASPAPDDTIEVSPDTRPSAYTDEQDRQVTDDNTQSQDKRLAGAEKDSEAPVLPEAQASVATVGDEVLNNERDSRSTHSCDRSMDAASAELAFEHGPALELQPIDRAKPDEPMGEDDDDEDHPVMTVPEGSSDDTCAICIDIMEDTEMVRLLTCGHIFHSDCVDPWLTRRRAYCPLCKTDFYVPKPDEDETLSRPATNQDSPEGPTVPEPAADVETRRSSRRRSRSRHRHSTPRHNRAHHRRSMPPVNPRFY